MEAKQISQGKKERTSGCEMFGGESVVGGCDKRASGQGWAERERIVA